MLPAAIRHAYLFIALFTLTLANPLFAATPYHSPEEMVADQSVIRVLMDDAPGFGNQSATINVIDRLTQMHFQGTFEFIYPDEQIEQLIRLFDLPKNIPPVYHYTSPSGQRITFFLESEYIHLLQNHQIKPIFLSITGAHDADEEHAFCNNDDVCQFIAKNFADFMQAKIFVELQPWFDQNFHHDQFDIAQDPTRYDVTPAGKYLLFPIANLNDAQQYIASHTHELAPALKSLVAGIQQGSFYFMPVYGFTIQEKYNWDNGDEKEGFQYYFPTNILQIIAGARYAQLHGNDALRQKPLIISVFYDYQEEIHELATLLHSQQWGKYDIAGGDQMRRAIQTLQLDDSRVLLLGSLSDADIAAKIALLKPGQILLLSMGPLPKVVFDGIYTYTSPTTWPAIREGESSLNTLFMSGKPHFRCADRYIPQDDPNPTPLKSSWEPGDELIQDQTFKQRFNQFYDAKDGFCANQIWVHQPLIYQTFGELLIDAATGDSALSAYFVQVKKDMLNANNDRILQGLEAALTVRQGSGGG